MKTIETTEKELKQLLKTDKPLMSEEFWQSSNSDNIYYMDSDLETVMASLKEDYNKKFILESFDIYYIDGLDSYVAVWK